MYGWLLLALAIGYIGFLFAIAYFGDRRRDIAGHERSGWIYPLSLAVYCTSWTYFGSVGLASRQGLDFIPIYLGPILLYSLGFPLIIHVRRLARDHNITSIADFLASRYGKSQPIAALVSVLLLMGMLPYLALQLKAVASSLLAALARSDISDMVRDLPFFGDLALVIATGMAIFAILFGTRQIEATEHQHGLMLAIATESIVKLVCFIIVGLFVCYGLFDGFGDILAKATLKIDSFDKVWFTQDPANWFTMLALSALAGLMLPRMFHAAIVENRSDSEIRRAAWLFPLYLIGINIFVLPIALAGLILLPPGFYESDMFVIALPLHSGNLVFTIIAFIGGLSAATAMVIVVCVALSIMLSNGLVVPALVRFPRFHALMAPDGPDAKTDMLAVVLRIRRLLIVLIMMGAYAYFRLAGGSAHLANFGLIAFAAVAQLAPAFFIGLVWRRANGRGAFFGLLFGGIIWAYTLLLPTFVTSGLIGQSLLDDGPFGIEWLRPEHLFGLELVPLVHSTVVSLSVNLVAFIIGAFSRPLDLNEVPQAESFVVERPKRTGGTFRTRGVPVTIGALQETVGRYLGRERTSLSFASFAKGQNLILNPAEEAPLSMIRFAEHLLASAIGAASSRLVMSLLLKQKAVSPKAALQLLNDASAAIQYDRDVLQAALDHARQGLSVFDSEGRLQFWNPTFLSILNLPADFASVGMPFQRIITYLGERGEFGDNNTHHTIRAYIDELQVADEAHRVRLKKAGLILEIKSAQMPDGGMVTTYTDMTATVQAADQLERANETLERRVRERTEELTRLNAELAQAKAEADEANLSKTRFLAAASHDVLQPLNAARLYTTSLVERESDGKNAALVGNIDASLEAVEEILGALLDMSRLDSGVMRVEWSSFRLDELMNQLRVEFAPVAEQKNLTLSFHPCSLSVRSDRRLLRRLLQNLISNAIKYTQHGRVIVGCRRKGEKIVVEVWDTGIGIPDNKRKLIFKEFQRLETGAKVARGLGLGLSIVERISRILGHDLKVESRIHKGSVFRLELPLAVAVPHSKAQHSPELQVSGGLAGFTVMAIDNEEAILEGMALLLSNWGCTVLTAPDARKAIDAVRKAGTIPDALIADYHLDDGTGIEAVTHLRWRFGVQMPAVLVTADRTVDVRHEAEAKDINLLNKPLKPAALRALLSQWKTLKTAKG